MVLDKNMGDRRMEIGGTGCWLRALGASRGQKMKERKWRVMVGGQWFAAWAGEEAGYSAGQSIVPVLSFHVR
jgi:hypothetical protein